MHDFDFKEQVDRMGGTIEYPISNSDVQPLVHLQQLMSDFHPDIRYCITMLIRWGRIIADAGYRWYIYLGRYEVGIQCSIFGE